ncbi:MAG: hypothetical protein II822_07400 [Prevotella sp.]|nr:hypothetical protein [Prevotella sp.]
MFTQTLRGIFKENGGIKMIKMMKVCQLFGSFNNCSYLCGEKLKSIMCTVTLEYNKSNALARRKLAALLATGLFVKLGEEPDDAYKPTPEEVEAHRELRDAMLEHSRKSMSHIIARYV